MKDSHPKSLMNFGLRGLARSGDKLKTHISIATMLIATKLGMMVIYK